MKSGMMRWKIEVVVEAVGGELAEVLDRLRRVLVVQLEHDRAGVGVRVACDIGHHPTDRGR
jgi:hypothetical protein